MKTHYRRGFALWASLFLLQLSLGSLAAWFVPHSGFSTYLSWWTSSILVTEVVRMFTRPFAMLAWTLFYLRQKNG